MVQRKRKALPQYEQFFAPLRRGFWERAWTKIMSTLKVKIWRGAETGEFQEYDVPRLESQTVLDVVTYVQRRLEIGRAHV